MLLYQIGQLLTDQLLFHHCLQFPKTIFFVLQALQLTVLGNGFFFGGVLRKMFWSSEDRVRARFHYAESRQK